MMNKLSDLNSYLGDQNTLSNLSNKGDDLSIASYQTHPSFITENQIQPDVVVTQLYPKTEHPYIQNKFVTTSYLSTAFNGHEKFQQDKITLETTNQCAKKRRRYVLRKKCNRSDIERHQPEIIQSNQIELRSSPGNQSIVCGDLILQGSEDFKIKQKMVEMEQQLLYLKEMLKLEKHWLWQERMLSDFKIPDVGI